MARNGAELYVLPTGTAAIAGQLASAADVNARFDDIAADLNLARPVLYGGTGATTVAGARSALGLNIGVNVQAFSDGLTSLSGLGTAADKMLLSTAANVWSEIDVTTLGKTFLGLTSAAAGRSALGLGSLATENILDEDDMVTNSATRPPSQRSLRVYAASEIATAITAAENARIPAEGYVTYSGTTPTLASNRGFASVSRPAVGDTEFVFTTAQPDTNYTIQRDIQGGLGGTDFRYQSWILAKSTTGFTVRHRFTTLSAQDVDFSVMVRRL